MANHAGPSNLRRSAKKRKFEEEEEQEDSQLEESLDSGSGHEDEDEDEDDSDMDPEKPHAVAWEDDEDLEEDLTGDSGAGESNSDLDDDDDDARLNRLQRGMASLPFGTLLQAKREAEPSSDEEEESGSESDKDSDDEPPEEEENAKPTDWKIAADRKAVPKRVTKTAPAVETSKKPVSRFRQVVEVKKIEARDPRFSSLSAGEFDAGKFSSSYGFITDIQKDEAKKIRHTIRDIKKTLPDALPNTRQQEIRRIEGLKRDLNRTETNIKKARKEAREREILMQARQEEKERRKEGKGEWYLKDSEKRKLLLQARFAEMEAEGGQRRVKKFLEKKEKEMAQKEKKARPYAKGEFYRDTQSEGPRGSDDRGRKGRKELRQGRSLDGAGSNPYGPRFGPSVRRNGTPNSRGFSSGDGPQPKKVKFN